MTSSLEQARLQKAREIASAEWGKDGSSITAARIASGGADNEFSVTAALAALTLANWEPPEDPDEREAIAILRADYWYGTNASDEIYRRSSGYRVTLAALKRGRELQKKGK